MFGFVAVEAKPFLYAFLVFLRGEFADFDNVNVHSIRVMGLGRSCEGLVRLVSRFGVLLGDLIGMFPSGLEKDGFFVPIVDGSRNGVHGHDVAHGRKGMWVEKYLMRTFWLEMLVRDE